MTAIFTGQTAGPIQVLSAYTPLEIFSRFSNPEIFAFQT